MLTREQILAEPAGEQLDRWVAEHVFGVKARGVRVQGSTDFVTVHTDNPAVSDGVWSADELRRYGRPREYSTQIEDAWLVVEKLSDRFWFEVSTPFHPGAGFWARCDLHNVTDATNPLNSSRRCDTVPLAICRAALLAVSHPAPATRPGSG